MRVIEFWREVSVFLKQDFMKANNLKLFHAFHLVKFVFQKVSVQPASMDTTSKKNSAYHAQRPFPSVHPAQ